MNSSNNQPRRGPDRPSKSNRSNNQPTILSVIVQPSNNLSNLSNNNSTTSTSESTLILNSIDQRLQRQEAQLNELAQQVNTIQIERREPASSTNITPTNVVPINRSTVNSIPPFYATEQFKIDQSKLNKSNYLTWYTYIETKIQDWNAEHLITNEPTEEEKNLNNKIFLAIYSNIEDEVKATLIITSKTVKGLLLVIKEKCCPHQQIRKQVALKNLRNVTYDKQFNVVNFSER